MDSEISRIQVGRPLNTPGQVLPTETKPRAHAPKPILDGGLSVTLGAYQAPGEVRDVDAVEEPSREDPIGLLVGKLFELPPPDMPRFE